MNRLRNYPIFILLFSTQLTTGYTQVLCWKQVAVGYSHTLGLKEDGSLWSWGSNEFGQLGDSTTNNKNTPSRIGLDSNWKEIAAGSFHSIALKQDGILGTWGFNNF